MASFCVLAVAVSTWRREDTSPVAVLCLWVTYGLAFALTWPPVWIPLVTATVLCVLFVSVLRRFGNSASSIIPLALFIPALTLFALALLALSFLFRGDQTSYSGPVSPNGMLVVESQLFDPGAMGSLSLSIDVVPRLLPLISKRVSSGSGGWTGAGQPDVRWKNDSTLEIGGRSVQVLGPSWGDTE